MKKDFIIITAIILFVAILFSGTKIQSVEQYQLTHIDDITANSKTVTLEIESKSLLSNESLLKPELRAYLPTDGVVLEKKEYVLRNGDTAFDLLQRATRYHQIQMEYQGANDNAFKSAYIQGINYLYEFSAGSQSGWMYAVNGEFPNVGVSRYLLKDGDEVQFKYTINLGDDIGGGQ
ncbi:MAG: DUF4430 domain-containing protein [Kurthia sp.]|nr:DUF4430 domain-containing protein [Candidatus Kurthia equi]